jgi:hypothetical protein
VSNVVSSLKYLIFLWHDAFVDDRLVWSLMKLQQLMCVQFVYSALSSSVPGHRYAWVRILPLLVFCNGLCVRVCWRCIVSCHGDRSESAMTCSDIGWQKKECSVCLLMHCNSAFWKVWVIMSWRLCFTWSRRISFRFLQSVTTYKTVVISIFITVKVSNLRTEITDHIIDEMV